MFCWINNEIINLWNFGLNPLCEQEEHSKNAHIGLNLGCSQLKLGVAFKNKTKQNNSLGTVI